MQELFEDLAPEAQKKVVVVLGRFQPPHLGHYLIIDAAKKFIRHHPDLNLEAAPVVVIIGGSKSDEDTSRNPLSIEDRERFMRASGRANGVIFYHARNAFAALSLLRSKGFEPLAVAAGSDRAVEYKEILDQYFKTSDDEPIKHYAIDVARNTTSSGTASTDVKKVSGSVARRAVELGYEPEFARIVGLESKPKLAKQLFNKMQASLKKSDKGSREKNHY